MKNYLRYITCLTLFLINCIIANSIHAEELTFIKNVKLIDDAANDGDSFKVIADGRELHLRLYYVDCPETVYSSKSDVERILEQQRHFGLENERTVVKFGEEATTYVRQVLSQPFTIHTSYARAPGRSAIGRHYVFVETQGGNDLGRLLVARGLARVHGKTHSSPDGTPSETALEELQDLRDTAMLKRIGIWGKSNPDILVKLRSERRKDKQKIDVIRGNISGARTLKDNPLNLNKATSKQLQQVPNIGPVTATRIIAGRPYRSIQELLKVPGIGIKKFKTISKYVSIKE